MILEGGSVSPSSRSGSGHQSGMRTPFVPGGPAVSSFGYSSKDLPKPQPQIELAGLRQGHSAQFATILFRELYT